jgi:hypothetical protein
MSAYVYSIDKWSPEDAIRNVNLLRATGVKLILTSDPDFDPSKPRFNHGVINDQWDGFIFGYIVNGTCKYPVKMKNFELALKNPYFVHFSFDIEPASKFKNPEEQAASEKLITEANVLLERVAETGKSVSAYVNPRQVHGVTHSHMVVEAYTEMLEKILQRCYDGKVIIPAYPGPGDNTIVNIKHAVSLAQICKKMNINCSFAISGTDIQKNIKKEVAIYTRRLNDLTAQVQEHALALSEPIIYRIGGGSTQHFKDEYIEAFLTFLHDNGWN